MDYKRYYQKLIKTSISDKSWYRVRRLLKDNDLILTKSNLDLLASLKAEASKHKISIESILKYYLEVSKIDSKMQGLQLFNYVFSLVNYKPHISTIYRWFENFEDDKIYTNHEISKVLLKAFIYKLRNQNATNQSSNRSRSLPTKKA